MVVSPKIRFVKVRHLNSRKHSCACHDCFLHFFDEQKKDKKFGGPEGPKSQAALPSTRAAAASDDAEESDESDGNEDEKSEKSESESVQGGSDDGNDSDDVDSDGDDETTEADHEGVKPSVSTVKSRKDVKLIESSDEEEEPQKKPVHKTKFDQLKAKKNQSQSCPLSSDNLFVSG